MLAVGAVVGGALGDWEVADGGAATRARVASAGVDF